MVAGKSAHLCCFIKHTRMWPLNTLMYVITLVSNTHGYDVNKSYDGLIRM